MPAYLLADAVIAGVSGPDAERYLNARLSNDVKSLEQGRFLRAAALTPQGKTQGLFQLCRLPEGGFLLVCDGGERAAVLQGLKRFIVADRVEVADLSETQQLWHVVGDDDFGRTRTAFEIPPNLEPGAVLHGGAAHVFCSKRLGEPGWDIIASPHGLRERFAAASIAVQAEDDFHARRFARGIPAFPGEINEDFLFSESGAADCLSFNKGCYAGQEVIEKIAARGKLPAKLMHAVIAGGIPVQTGDEIFEDCGEERGAAVGKVVTARYHAGHDLTYAFVRLNKYENSESRQLQLNGMPLAVRQICSGRDASQPD